jgi:folate-dependent phosphoribosylglycinamide formyltransferase PurN
LPDGEPEDMGQPLVEASSPLRVAVLTSTAGPRLRHLLAADPNRGSSHRFVCGVVNDVDSGADDLLAEHDVPVERHDIHDFYEERGADLSDLDVREEFDDRLASTVEEYDPDLVLLVGYLHVLTHPFVARFHPRILNCHHGDLTVRDAAGSPLYTGLNAVEDAIRNSEAATRETVHVATEDVDAGPVVVRSPPFEVNRPLVEDALARGDDAVLDAYVYAHRRWMAAAGGGPALAAAIELVADGRVGWEGGRTTVDGVEGFFQVGEGVRAGVRPTAGDDA